MLEFINLRDYAIDHYNIDILKRCRKADNVRIRQAISTILYTICGYKAVDIGRQLNSDHTMVVYYRNTHEIRYEQDLRYANIYDDLISSVRPSDHSVNKVISYLKNLC